MIDLERRDGAVLRIAHRGASALAPENTLRAFRTAVAQGVDLIEFDVLDLPRGPLVLAHSDRLDEVSHGAAAGSVRERSLGRAARGRARAADARRGACVLRRRGAGARAPRRPQAHDPARRAHVGPPAPRSRAADGRLVLPRAEPARRRAGRARGADRLHVPGGSLRRLAPAGAGAGAPRGLVALRAGAPAVLPRMIRRAGATALMLQHALVTPRAVARAHALSEHRCSPGRSTTPPICTASSRQGSPGVITNDPGIFAAIRT